MITLNFLHNSISAQPLCLSNTPKSITAGLVDFRLCQEVGPSLIYTHCPHQDILSFFYFRTRASAKTLSTNRVMVRDGHSPCRVSPSFCDYWRGFDTRAAASQVDRCLTRILINICSRSTHHIQRGCRRG